MGRYWTLSQGHVAWDTRSQTPLNEMHAYTPSQPFVFKCTRVHPLSDPHTLPFTDPDASGLTVEVPLPAPAPSKEAGMVDA